jgi:hypothetical protein
MPFGLFEYLFMPFGLFEYLFMPFGLFEYLFMPFGLSNTAQTFQRMMDRTWKIVSTL